MKDEVIVDNGLPTWEFGVGLIPTHPHTHTRILN